MASKYKRGGQQQMVVEEEDSSSNQQESNSTYDDAGGDYSIELKDMKTSNTGEKYQGVQQQSTEVSSARGEKDEGRGGKVPTHDEDLDETNKYTDDDDDGEEEEEEEEESSGEDSQMDTDTRNQMDVVKEQYDKQLGELYKRNREKAVKLRQEKEQRKSGKQGGKA